MSSGHNVPNYQEQICYVQCVFCSTMLLVNVPCSSLSKVVITVKCGHCNSILSVHMMKACLVPIHFFPSLNQQEQMSKLGVGSEEVVAENKVANTCYRSLCFSSDDEISHKPPVKKQRAPSAYNRFIKEEVKRLKIEYPNMTHKQAFSAASKNWAHFPQSQYKGGEVNGEK